ncbi:MAG TPA: fatty acid--CoA ligase [Terriglobales bacterium]|nr:fatty acid--CoA ligase [Terriglobales bacterium]
MNIPLTPIRFLRYAEQQFPKKVGVVCGDRRFTYAEFADRVSRLAGALRSLGVQPGDRVAFLSTNCHRLLEAYYGVPEAGGILLALNVRLSAQELTYVLNNSGAKILFFEGAFLPLVEAFRDAVPQIKTFVLQDDTPRPEWATPNDYDELLEAAEPYRCDFMQIDEDSVAELFYTSGTGANPKGVMLTHRNIYLHALSVIMGLGIIQDTVQLHTIPLFHANGWGAAHTVTLLGARHVMIHRFDPRDVFRLVEQEKVTTFCVVPPMGIALVNCPEIANYDLSSLQRVNIGGAAGSPTLVRQIEEKLGCFCFVGYGLTETSPVLTFATPKNSATHEDERRFEQQARTGFPLPGVEVRIVGTDGNDVPRDGQTMGEIWARGDGVMLGYWNDPESTARVFEDGWFRTGDVATIDDDGYVLIMDRRKDMILSGGENVSSLEVEKVLAAHLDVYEVAVIPVPDTKWGEVPKAIVVLKPGTSATEAELIDFCRARLAHYKCPKSVEFVDVLPKTGTGKLLKRELRKKYWPPG